MYYWLNVDFPTQRATLHYSFCRHTDDIGWRPFETPEEAEDYVQGIDRALMFKHCKDCL